MKKFIRLGVINFLWSDNIVRYKDIKKVNFFRKHQCKVCDKYFKEGFKLDKCNLKTIFKSTSFKFCGHCLRNSETPSQISYERLVADYVNLILLKDIFTAKKVHFRKTDILAVEGCAYEHSMIYFNSNTSLSGRTCVRVSENKDQVLRYLGETYNK